jgi:23S rRNA pseudouridine1911/1915/1917 synthase
MDQVLAELWSQHSRNRLQAWVREGRVVVDGQVECEPKRKLMGGETLILNEPEGIRELAEQPEDIPLDIVFEDDELLVINKPPGLVVHPGSGNWTGTLMNALLHHIPGIAEVPRAGIVHRLDKDTSGLLVVAKTLEAQTDLVRQLQARTVKRQYLAIVSGIVRRDGMVEAPIGRHPVHRVKMAIVPETLGGKPAITHFRVLEEYAHCTLLECALETGRTHQIRVHLASIRHPLVGDQVYGKVDPRVPLFHRQALHATRLGLVHPLTRRLQQWEAPPPADMLALLETLRGE